jgi:poly(A) polymerase
VKPKIYHASDHDIDPALIDPDAIHIVTKLKEAGFSAYLVGGSVRDLLVKKQPKDFDISTSARPEQIKQLFQRNCLLIGKRFRLAHIRFNHRIFEVSTFRSGENDSDLIVRDNCWGTPEEDVLRRDFTINGLFYDPSTHTVIDYVGGWHDIHKNLLKTIGEPIIRFKQDPVRMIRLLKFQSRFNFHVAPETATALVRCVHEIVKSSPARILEEILRMLESGASSPFFRLLTSSGLLELLFPCLDHFLKGEYGEDAYKLLHAADEINKANEKRPLDRAILLSCLLYPILEREIETVFLKHHKIPNYAEIMTVTSSLVKGLVISSFAHFPKRLSSEAAFILSAQYRLTPPNGKRHQRSRIFHNKEFELALKFLKIRSIADPELKEAFEWWVHQKRLVEMQTERHGHRHHPGPENKKSMSHHES